MISSARGNPVTSRVHQSIMFVYIYFKGKRVLMRIYKFIFSGLSALRVHQIKCFNL